MEDTDIEQIDAVNKIMAEDLENTCETLGKNLETDEVAQSCDEVGAELQDEPVSNSDRLETETGTVAENETVEESDELVGNSEQLEPEIPEPESYIRPWADAPENTIYYEKIYEDGHLGSFTESAEMAYKMGWYENRISKDDVQQSDINGWTYRKESCPMKSERELQIEGWNREIFELKEELNRTDYRAIKYAEGVLTDEEYQETGIQRQVWRKRINELEKLIAG